jgi:hypothetical protein
MLEKYKSPGIYQVSIIDLSRRKGIVLEIHKVVQSICKEELPEQLKQSVLLVYGLATTLSYDCCVIMFLIVIFTNQALL